MVSLVAAVIGVGYTLVYAAVANGGRLAEEPWRAFVEDAYSGESPSASWGGFIGTLVGGAKSFLHFLTHPFGLSIPLPFLP